MPIVYSRSILKDNPPVSPFLPNQPNYQDHPQQQDHQHKRRYQCPLFLLPESTDNPIKRSNTTTL